MLYSVFTYEPCWAFISQFSLIIIYQVVGGYQLTIGECEVDMSLVNGIARKL